MTTKLGLIITGANTNPSITLPTRSGKHDQISA